MTVFHCRLYLAVLTTFLALDALWIGVVARNFYREQIGFLLAPEPNWAAAGIFYLLFVAAIQFFVVMPGIREGSVKPTLLRGAFFGLVTYATYDLTNLATAKDWPLLVTVVDLIWGTVLSLSVGWVGFRVGRRWPQP